jgi:Protein of unknown function (DUF2786)
MAHEALLDRVHKLLALATSPNVHEAAQAAARAQRLIAQHRLEAWLAPDSDPDPIIDAVEAPLEVSRRIRKWKVVLACALAEANGCVAYTRARGGEEAIVLVGRARDREAVGELWSWLVRRIEWLSATHGPGKPRQWHEAFRIGAVDAVVERLNAAEQEVRAEHSEGLVRIDVAAAAHRRALDRFVAERLGLGRGRAIRVDSRAWERGRAAGEALDLPE